jgi:hypothetical protein
VKHKYTKKDAHGNDQEWCCILKPKCRFGFGYQLREACGPDQDRTGGTEFSPSPRLALDDNGIFKFHARRNHHRLTQEPLFSYSWGANNNTQRFLTDSTSFDKMPQPTEKYYKAMHLLGTPGVCWACGSWTCNCYVTGYNCKGFSTSMEWGLTFNQIAKSYVSEDPAT